MFGRTLAISWEAVLQHDDDDDDDDDDDQDLDGVEKKNILQFQMSPAEGENKIKLFSHISSNRRNSIFQRGSKTESPLISRLRHILSLWQGS